MIVEFTQSSMMIEVVLPFHLSPAMRYIQRLIEQEFS